jgi:hypothetical protein
MRPGLERHQRTRFRGLRIDRMSLPHDRRMEKNPRILWNEYVACLEEATFGTAVSNRTWTFGV